MNWATITIETLNNFFGWMKSKSDQETIQDPEQKKRVDVENANEEIAKSKRKEMKHLLRLDKLSWKRWKKNRRREKRKTKKMKDVV